MNNKIITIFAALSVMLFSSMSSVARADIPNISLSDVLTKICKKPFCVDYSGNNRIVSTDGTRIAVKDWSPGNANKPTFLLIHGYPHGQGLWINQILSGLPAQYRLVTMDVRGSGGSDVPPPGNYEAQNYGDDIQAIIDSLGLKNVILVGHSYGGVSISSYVKTHGLSQIKGIVTVGSFPSLPNAVITPDIFALVVETISSDPQIFLQATKDFADVSHYKHFFLC